MSIPLSLPSEIGPGSIQINAENVAVVSESPFSFQQKIIRYPGQRWSASVTVPPLNRSQAEPWIAFLLSLEGNVGTFFMGDPNATQPRGTISSANLTGSKGSSSPNITMTGTLLAGDYIQIGSGSTTKLHKVLVDRSGSGELKIWPALRTDVTNEPVVFTNTVGVFRKTSPSQGYSIDNNGRYNITFDCVESITP